MNVEGGPGPVPDEVEQASQPEAAPTAEPAQPPRVPPRPRGFWGRIWRRRPEHDILDNEDIRQASEDSQQLAADQAEQRRAERMFEPEQIRTPNTPEELAELLAQMTEGQWRERQIRERYGEGRLGRLKAFLAGERDFELTEDGETRRNAWNEITRKVASIGLKIAPGTAAVGIIGVFTGGIGLPAAGALFGAAGGRGFVEAWHSLNGGERKIREEIARVQYHQWFRLHEIAQSTQEEGISDEQRNERLTRLIDAFHQTNDNIAERQRELVGVQAVWNRRRKIGQLIGGVAGLGAGIWAGFADLSRQAMTMDIDGDKVSHLVEKVNGDWHYVYNNQQQAAEWAKAQFENLQGITPDAFGRLTHTLGESTATVVMHVAKNLSGHAAQIGGLLAGLWAGGALSRACGADNEAGIEAQRARREAMTGLEREFQHEQMPPPAGPEPVPQEQIRWQEQFESREKPMPAANDVWVIPGYGIIRINQVDFAGGRATVTALNPDLSVIVDRGGNRVENVQFNLSDISEHGSRRDGFEDAWRSRFNPDDDLKVRQEMNLVDQGGRPVEPGDYRVTVDDERMEARLHREGAEDHYASFLALAFADLRRVERAPSKEPQERITLPRERQIWQIINRDQLPEDLRALDLPERFVIASADQDEINVYNLAERNATFTIDTDDWPALAGQSRRAGMAPAGGGGQRGRGGEAGRGGQQ